MGVMPFRTGEPVVKTKEAFERERLDRQRSAEWTKHIEQRLDDAARQMLELLFGKWSDAARLNGDGVVQKFAQARPPAGDGLRGRANRADQGQDCRIGARVATIANCERASPSARLGSTNGGVQTPKRRSIAARPAPDPGSPAMPGR